MTWTTRGGALRSVFTGDHLTELDSIVTDMNDVKRRDGPRFDLTLVQRYILWRVFDLGWTIERFGDFDRFQVSHWGREAAKAERIGKKYQWIAYHEILAYISDHYQYRTSFAEDEGGPTVRRPMAGLSTRYRSFDYRHVHARWHILGRAQTILVGEAVV